MADKEPTSPALAATPAKDVTLPAPLLLDAVRYLVELGAILFALFVFVTSLINGAEPFTAGARAAAALFVIGLLGWVTAYLLANTFLWVLRTLKPKEETPPTSTQSWEA